MNLYTNAILLQYTIINAVHTRPWGGYTIMYICLSLVTKSIYSRNTQLAQCSHSITYCTMLGCDSFRSNSTSLSVLVPVAFMFCFNTMTWSVIKCLTCWTNSIKLMTNTSITPQVRDNTITQVFMSHLDNPEGCRLWLLCGTHKLEGAWYLRALWTYQQSITYVVQ